MSFQWPLALLLLLPVLAIAVTYFWQQSRRVRYAVRYSNVGIVVGATSRSSRLKRHGAAVAYLLALAAMAVALARPQATVPNAQATGIVMLTIDASGSMNSNDIRPSRIDAARVAVREFVEHQPKGVKIGVVTFAGWASVLVPPTTDRKQVTGAVDYVTLARGTNIGEGLLAALNAILEEQQGEPVSLILNPDYKPPPGQVPDAGAATIVLLSDGAATTGPSPIKIAEMVSQAGIRVHTVGLGARVAPRPAPAQGQQGPIFGGGGFMELDESTLKGIAELTDGKYYTAEDAGQLQRVYRDLSLNVEGVMRHDELTFLMAGFGALFLIGAAVMTTAWGPRLP